MSAAPSSPSSPSDASLRGEVDAYHDEHLRDLADKPNTTVYKTEYDTVREPWKAADARRVAERIAERTASFGDEASDFALRKALLEDEEVLRFQRCHPKLYYLLTDRKMVGEPRFRQALGAMLTVRDKVEAGQVEGMEADAMATSGIVAALQQ
jgi:hypothetical protein